MSTIKEYRITDSGYWDEVVKSFPNYDVFYLSGYANAFMKENKKNGEPILLVYENGQDKAINVVFRRDVSFDEKLRGLVSPASYYDLITPYGYGGFIGSITDWNELNWCYNSYCKENSYVCEFVRFELFSEYYRYYDGETETRTHNVVRDLEMSLDEIWMDFKAKVRKNVKKANSNNLKIIIEPDGDYLKDFLRIYYATMDRSDAENEFYFSEEFYRNLSRLKDNVMYFHVVYEGKIISTELVMYDAENCYSYLGGTDREYFDLRPNDFLKYEIIRWAKDKGLKNFVLGGGYGADDGIFNYKQSLAPNGVVDFYIGRKIFDKVAYEKLVALRKGDTLNEKFFPLYRS